MRSGRYVLAVMFAMVAMMLPSSQVWAYSRPPLPLTVPAVSSEPCPGTASEAGVACFDPDGNVIYAPDGLDRFERAHEYGHAFDHQLLDDAERARFSKLIGKGDRPWQTLAKCKDGVCEGTATLGNEEYFADEYATCRLGLLPQGHVVHRHGERFVVGGWWTSYGYVPNSNRAQRRICRSMARWAG